MSRILLATVEVGVEGRKTWEEVPARSILKKGGLDQAGHGETWEVLFPESVLKGRATCIIHYDTSSVDVRGERGAKDPSRVCGPSTWHLLEGWERNGFSRTHQESGLKCLFRHQMN